MPFTMWNKYEVTIQVDKLTGGWPTNRKLLDAWLSAKNAPEAGKPILSDPEAGFVIGGEAEAEEQLARQQEFLPEETHAVVFWRDESGTPCYESRCFKAALKEAANVMKADSLLAIKNFKAKAAERIFVLPKVGGCPIVCGCSHPERHNAAGMHVDERPISVMTPQGPRTSIKRYEHAFNVTLRFELWVLNDHVVRATQLRALFEYLEFGGVGADRSQGSGTFNLVDFKTLVEAKERAPEPEPAPKRSAATAARR